MHSQYCTRLVLVNVQVTVNMDDHYCIYWAEWEGGELLESHRTFTYWRSRQGIKQCSSSNHGSLVARSQNSLSYTEFAGPVELGNLLLN